jgi:hypothetical protein
MINEQQLQIDNCIRKLREIITCLCKVCGAMGRSEIQNDQQIVRVLRPR